MHLPALILPLLASQLVTESLLVDPIVFPDDAGVVDVTQAPYGAIPDDGEDDAPAIQKALNDHSSGNVIIYFPPGQYDIGAGLLDRPEGDPLRNTRACLELRGKKKRNILQGAGETYTTLRLMDDVPESFAGAMLNFGPTPAQRFRNGLRSMHVSVGVGHPNAVGVEFNASNQGGIFDVVIGSEDESHAGRIGLDMRYTDEVGPLLVQNLSVQGFDVGIRTGYQTASQTFLNVRFDDQQTCCWQNGFSQSVFASRVVSGGSVPAIVNAPLDRGDPGQGRFVLLNSDLTRRDVSVPAIRNQKSMYVGNVHVNGSGPVVTRELTAYRGNRTHQTNISEYWANGGYERRRGGPFELFPTPDHCNSHAPPPLPEVQWEHDLGRWVGPHLFPIGDGGAGDDGQPDTQSLQAAMNARQPVVYLPNGNWVLDGVVTVPPHVTRVIGCEARIVGREGVLRVLPRSAPLVIERLELGGTTIDIGGPDGGAFPEPIIIRNTLGGCITCEQAEGLKLYCFDVACGAMSIGEGQSLRAYQLNIETDTEREAEYEAKIVNDGGEVWILGLKTENAGTAVLTRRGGRSWLHGHLHVGSAGDDPCYVTDEASFWGCCMGIGSFATYAQETRGGVTRTAQTFNLADVYTAVRPADWSGVVVDSEDKTGVTTVGEWQTAAPFGGGFHGESLAFTSGKAEASMTFAAQLPEPGWYRVDLHWPAPRSGFELASDVKVTVEGDGEPFTGSAKQSEQGGGWNAVGEFRFDQVGKVTLDVPPGRRPVVGDAVRFVPVSAPE